MTSPPAGSAPQPATTARGTPAPVRRATACVRREDRGRPAPPAVSAPRGTRQPRTTRHPWRRHRPRVRPVAGQPIAAASRRGYGRPSAVRRDAPANRSPRRHMPSVQRRAVGGVDGVQQVADREHPGAAGRAGPRRPPGPRVAGSIARPPVRASSWSGIQSPVNTTVSHSTLAARPLSMFSTTALRTRSLPWMPTIRLRVNTGPSIRNRPGDPEHRIGLRSRVAADHSDGGAAGFAQGQDRRPAHQFGADDQRAAADVCVVQVHEVLQLPGGVHAVGPVAGYQPRGAGPLPRAGRQHHRVGRDGSNSPRRGDLQPPVAGPAGDHRLGLQHARRHPAPLRSAAWRRRDRR